jgi:ureidoacrylate peracid hydrolase
MVNFAVVPERTALVNVDMQNCFVEGSPFSARAGLVVLACINRLAAACRAAGILVIHSAHVLRPDGSNTGVLGGDCPTCQARDHRQGFKVGRPTSGSGRKSR